MSFMSTMSSALVTGMLMLAASGSTAFAADQIRVRGVVEKLEGNILLVKDREGSDTKIVLKDGWKISSVVKASVDDVKTGDFVGIGSVPTAEGGDGALSVLIFPAAMRGTGEGSYAWDLKPNGSMTNATVSSAVKSVDGQTITVNYQGKERKIAVPPGTPVVTFASATPADLTSGASVFIPSEKAADGTISTRQVVVGANGLQPPM